MTTKLVAHAGYISWAAKAVRQANLAWRSRRPYAGEVIMTREGLHRHLFRWGLLEGRIKNPGAAQPRSESSYVAEVFDRDPEGVKEAARDYWRSLVEQHA
jgi:hypothetical protein